MSNSPMTQKLLDFLKRNRGRVVSQEEILRAIPEFISHNYIHKTIYDLRQQGIIISTIKSAGYEYMGEEKK